MCSQVNHNFSSYNCHFSNSYVPYAQFSNVLAKPASLCFTFCLYALSQSTFGNYTKERQIRSCIIQYFNIKELEFQNSKNYSLFYQGYFRQGEVERWTKNINPNLLPHPPTHVHWIYFIFSILLTEKQLSSSGANGKIRQSSSIPPTMLLHYTMCIYSYLILWRFQV